MRARPLAIVAGPCVAIIVYMLLPRHYLAAGGDPVALGAAARGTLAVGSWMALWWIAEAVPVAATALVPVAVFPLLGLNDLASVTASYAHPLIFLFFGGFLLSLAIEKWRLHAWIAQAVVGLTAGDARYMVGGFMLVAAFASMWLSNTATAIMMLPIAAAIIAGTDAGSAPGEADKFARCLLLGIAYGASIGGTATLIGSPPNLFAASYLQEHFGVALDFRRWMAIALPVALVMLPLTWLLLTRVIAPFDRSVAPALPAAPLRFAELPRAARRVALVFALAVLGWLTRSQLNALEIGGLVPFAHLTDTGIALLAGLALFVLPADADGERLMDWEDAERLPFGTLLLFGGGLALAATVTASGADRFIGAQLAGLAGTPPWLVLCIVIAAVVFLTELTSNTATTTTLVPILAAGAVVLGLAPTSLIVVTALSASCAFMMPVATPPNAIVFSSGRVPVAVMARSGLLVNLLAIAVITVLALTWIPWVTGNGTGT